MSGAFTLALPVGMARRFAKSAMALSEAYLVTAGQCFVRKLRACMRVCACVSVRAIVGLFSSRALSACVRVRDLIMLRLTWLRARAVIQSLHAYQSVYINAYLCFPGFYWCRVTLMNADSAAHLLRRCELLVARQPDLRTVRGTQCDARHPSNPTRHSIDEVQR